MGPRKEKRVKPKPSAEDRSRASVNTSSTIDSTFPKSSKKRDQDKPLTKKQKEKLKKTEKTLKERVAVLRKEAEAMLAEVKAMEESAAQKAATEWAQQEKRINILSTTSESYRMAKARLVHEYNKVRETQIWERYITTDQLPYPEDPRSMHTYLYLWHNTVSSEYMEFALKKCDICINILNLIAELIETPLYSTQETVNNWKEIREKWREEFFHKIDKACFNIIKNLAENFEPSVKEPYKLTYEETTDHLKFALESWTVRDNLVIVRSSPTISFSSINIQLVMPAAYRKRSFILRIVYIDEDFFSDSSGSFNIPEGLPMEPDLLREVQRCFEAKDSAKSSVADREREKVRLAKQKVMDAQAAASLAEKSFENFQLKSMEQHKKKSQSPPPSAEPEQSLETPIESKNKKRKEFTIKIEPSIDIPIGKRRGAPDSLEKSSTVKSLINSEGAQKSVDAISMRSGMRKKVADRLKKTLDSAAEEVHTNVFHTPSLISLSERKFKVEVRQASELIFEEPEEEESKENSISNPSASTVDSLNMMFGNISDDDESGVKSMKTLVRNTVVISREAKQRLTSRALGDSKSKSRKRGKSLASVRKLMGDTDEAAQTASEIFETREDARQENYMSSLVVNNVKDNLNLRAMYVVGGVYLLDIIFHVSQPHELPNGCSTQIFFGDLTIKRDEYEYDYVPLPYNSSVSLEEPPPVDPGLACLISIKVPLPDGLTYFEPPVVALWNNINKYWTQKHVYNCHLDFETKCASFQIGRVWPFAFLINKYVLLPYLKWHLKPKFDTGGVILLLSCQYAIFEFIILNFEVCLSKVEGLSDSSFVDDIIGVKFTVDQLIRQLKRKGLNVFPDKDAFLYVSENTAKDVVLEDHCYFVMGIFSDSLEFHSCQWNDSCKRRKLAFQVRESLNYNLELRYRTVCTTSLSASLYRCCDEDSFLDESKVEDVGFCPDVNSLFEKTFSHATSSSALNVVQVVTVYDFLSRTRVLSYSGFGKKETTSSSSDTSKKSPKKKSGKVPFKGIMDNGSRTSDTINEFPN